MKKAVISPSTFKFLKSISKNNNRDWFNANKDQYIAAYENMIAFADALLDEMNKHDKIETSSGKQSLYRIYKDTRFSNDKTPYKSSWSGGFSRATKQLRGGYYFHIEPGNSFAGGGFRGPKPEDLKRIRQDIDLNSEDWKKLLANKTLKKTFGNMRGKQVASAPRGYAKDHPAIEQLRHKQFIFRHNFSDKEVLSPDFAKKLSKTFKDLRPFFDYMSEVLTTDLNGISIV